MLCSTSEALTKQNTFVSLWEKKGKKKEMEDMKLEKGNKFSFIYCLST